MIECKLCHQFYPDGMPHTCGKLPKYPQPMMPKEDKAKLEELVEKQAIVDAKVVTK